MRHGEEELDLGDQHRRGVERPPSGAKGRPMRPEVNPLSEPQWYCVKTRAKSEHIAAASLARLEGVEVYCPRIRFQRSLARGKVWFTEALFPCYLFARFIADQQLRAVRYANAVTQLLMFGENYATLPPEIIEQIKEEMQGEDIRTVKQAPLEIGSELEVVSGPFRGMEGIVTGLLSGGQRVRILLQMFGELNEVELAREALPYQSRLDR